MFGASLQQVLLVAWGAVTLVFLAVLGWKSIIGLHEDDGIIIGLAESGRASEQQQVIAKVQRLTLWAKAFGFASLGMLVLLVGVWGYQGWLAFMGKQIPQ